MEAANTPTKPTLFSSLVAHEVTQPTSNERREPNHGLRPRLPNTFEMFDLNRDAQSPFEEQVEIPVPTQLTQNGIGKTGLDTNGLQPIVSTPIQEHPPQPVNMPKPKGHGQFDVPEFSHNGQQGYNQTPDEQPLAARILGAATAQMSNKSPIDSVTLQPELTQAQREHDSLTERTIVERTHNFEREIIHEIRPGGLFEQRTDQNVGVKPLLKPTKTLNTTRLSPTQTLIPQTEKSPEPTIEIHIGRIEVLAQVQAPPSKPEKTPAPSTNNGGLQAYLFNRSRGGRS